MIFNCIFYFIAEVLLNLTELETLDLSYNELTTFTVEKSGPTFPKKLANLYVSNNQLRYLSVEEFSNLTSVDLIDVRDNYIESFDLKILKKVENGLNLSIAGKLNSY